MPRNALVVDFGGEKFRFFYDRPGVLHIANRHGTGPADAIAAFFSAEATTWDEEHSALSH